MTDPQVVANLKGPVLNFGSPATALAPALLELTRTVLLQDAALRRAHQAALPDVPPTD